jgi:hypothetical protein
VSAGVRGAGPICGAEHITAASLSAVYQPGRGRVRPYAIGGVGMYERIVSTTWDGPTCPEGVACQAIMEPPFTIRDARRDLGASGGVGVTARVGRRSVFAELRYHHAFSGDRSWSIVPVTVGMEL